MIGGRKINVWVDNTKLEVVKSIKYLGEIIGDKLKFGGLHVQDFKENYTIE